MLSIASKVSVATAAYNTDLFDADTITRMLSHFRTLLEGDSQRSRHASVRAIIVDRVGSANRSRSDGMISQAAMFQLYVFISCLKPR